MRVCVPQGAVAGFDHPRYGRLHARDGIMDVPDDAGRALIRYAECFPAADIPKAAGFICDDCRFHRYFRTCGHCNSTCERPQPKEANHGSSSEEG